jgi:hypothetical protein
VSTSSSSPTSNELRRAGGTSPHSVPFKLALSLALTVLSAGTTLWCYRFYQHLVGMTPTEGLPPGLEPPYPTLSAILQRATAIEVVLCGVAGWLLSRAICDRACRRPVAWVAIGPVAMWTVAALAALGARIDWSAASDYLPMDLLIRSSDELWSAGALILLPSFALLTAAWLHLSLAGKATCSEGRAASDAGVEVKSTNEEI